MFFIFCKFLSFEEKDFLWVVSSTQLSSASFWVVESAGGKFKF